MATLPISKYHIAPNFSIPPIEAGGILQLGSLIDGIDAADEPFNEDCYVRIPQTELFCGHQEGFSASRKRLSSGEYGFWAKLVGSEGVGTEMRWANERSMEDVYEFRCVDTIYFRATKEYQEKSMNQPYVKDYIMASGYQPVYMVTGLKTARGPSVQMAKSKEETGNAEIGIPEAGSVPVALGPKANIHREEENKMGFKSSTDFIIGIRLMKLAYKKHWLTRAPGELVGKEHNKGATLVDDQQVARDYHEIVDLGDDHEGQTLRETESIEGKYSEFEWVFDGSGRKER